GLFSEAPMAERRANRVWRARRPCAAADHSYEGTTMKTTWALAVLAWLAAAAAGAQSRTIKGNATDVTTGDPVAGVTVTIEGTTLSTITASDGTFTIENAPPGTVNVSMRAPGYRGATVPVPEDQSDVRVGLSRELAEEIVVTGRASRTERRNLGVSIATVKSEDLTETPAQTVDTALQGKVTGANIQRNDGAPGGGVQVRLRGISTLSNKIGARNYGSLTAVLDQFCPVDATSGQRSSTCVTNQTGYYGSGTVYDHDQELAGRRDLGTETILSVSGGSKDLRYFVSGAVK